jgi:hypothetical protein
MIGKGPPNVGLRQLGTEQLQLLLKLLHRGELAFPLTPLELARIGLQDPSEYVLAVVRGLDQAAVRAVLVSVLAERLGE